MKRLAIVFLSVATAFSSYVPAQALPAVGTAIAQQAEAANVLQVRERRHMRRGHGWRGGRHHGWRGDRHHHRRYGRHRHHNRTGAIIGGLAAGAIIGGALSSRSSAGSHTQWCYNRYRSYRASDNTYQPNYGPRRACVSR